jgi:hypothetical protein
MRIHLSVILGPFFVLQRLPKALKDSLRSSVIRAGVLLKQMDMLKTSCIQTYVPTTACTVRKL